MNYFDWLVELIYADEYTRSCYQKVLSFLYSKPFVWSIDNDGNRATDGLMLRDIYENATGLHVSKYGPCSVLEMMIGLACRCEDDIMHDPEEGDRTYLWFWEMMDNLDLTNQDDYCYNEDTVEKIVNRFLHRKYGSDGYSGPFYIPNCDKDLRRVELWQQLNFYIEYKFFL